MLELVRAALIGASLDGVGQVSDSGLDDLLPPAAPETTLLRRAGLLELARRAAHPTITAAPLLEPAPPESAEPRPLAPPRIAAFIAYILRPPGKLFELHHELFSVIAARGLRLPPRLAPVLLTHPVARQHPDVPALLGARGAWLRQLLPATPTVEAKAPRRTKPKPPPTLPPESAWTPGAAPEPALVDALAHLPRPFAPPISAVVAAWLDRFRDGYELKRHPLGAAMRHVALSLQREHLPGLVTRTPLLYRQFREALVIAETRRRFYEELDRESAS